MKTTKEKFMEFNFLPIILIMIIGFLGFGGLMQCKADQEVRIYKMQHPEPKL